MGTPSRYLSIADAPSLPAANRQSSPTRLQGFASLLDVGIVTAAIAFAATLAQLLKGRYSFVLTMLSAMVFALALLGLLDKRRDGNGSTSPLNIKHTEHLLRVSYMSCLGAILTSQWSLLAVSRRQFWLLLAPSCIALMPGTSKLAVATKRLLDLLLALLGLVSLMVFAPILAVLVKISSPGPVLFSQDRVGKDGRLFVIYKFRTMYVDAPKYGYSPKGNPDPRVTPIGRFLRRSKLDELPQLINVLLGEMSLVGPRPEMPFIVEQYSDVQKKRLTVTPGITGLWQISEHRTAPIHEHLEYDFYYAEHRTVFLDLAILCRTLSCVTGRT